MCTFFTIPSSNHTGSLYNNNNNNNLLLLLFYVCICSMYRTFGIASSNLCKVLHHLGANGKPDQSATCNIDSCGCLVGSKGSIHNSNFVLAGWPPCFWHGSFYTSLYMKLQTLPPSPSQIWLYWTWLCGFTRGDAVVYKVCDFFVMFIKHELHCYIHDHMYRRTLHETLIWSP